MSRYRVTVDTGGTFSDFVYLAEDTGELSITKIASTPDDPSRAILQGIREARPAHTATSRSSVTAPRSAPTRCSKARASRPASW